jgi:hypothetical protein
VAVTPTKMLHTRRIKRKNERRVCVCVCVRACVRVACVR